MDRGKETGTVTGGGEVVKPSPRKRKPAEDPRAALLKEAADNFTYKDSPTEDQVAAYKWVVSQVSIFKVKMLRLLDFSTIRAPLTDTDDYKAYLDSIRVAERRANAAIACDWKKDSAFDIDTVELIEYPIVEDTHTDERQRLCYEISKATFELTMLFLAHLPLGRYLSLFRTEMENVRGWLIDTVNRNS